jgi:hypothetical protein
MGTGRRQEEKMNPRERVQRLGPFSILRLDELDLPKEFKGVTLIAAVNDESTLHPRQIWVKSELPPFARESREPSDYVMGILTAADEIWEGKDGASNNDLG